jgi:hypothetical protein
VHAEDISKRGVELSKDVTPQVPSY